jgi:predicted DNA-binding antitoxin AbrB/MazE fold protein
VEVVKTIKAIFENGVLRPVEPIEEIDDQSQVTITLETPNARRPRDGWVGGLSDEDASEMRRVIKNAADRPVTMAARRNFPLG